MLFKRQETKEKKKERKKERWEKSKKENYAIHANNEKQQERF